MSDRRYRRTHVRRRGFTILELMIASSVFAVILLVVAVGVQRFTSGYFKGVTSSQTQATARNIMSDVSQAIEFGTNITPTVTSSGVSGLCIDNTLYSYAVGQQVTDTAPNSGKHQANHALVVSNPSSCTASTTPSLPNNPLPSGSRELLGQHMRLSAFSVTGSGSLYTIHIRIIYGDDDLLTPAVSGSTNWATENCSGTAGSQFCAVSDLQTTVERRVL
ncbi:MAG TPA: prepilin-type N-terminal cleavage/methylation domain-containing protein [Candidatus Saccharimonadales bacterium]|nr:prepilin-type N-terminal cleavage/methylation domain-containing protein [Candidatus Saccharimonadales bacterium]